MPDQPAFGGGAAESIMHPAVMAALLITILLVLCLPRKYVVVPFLLSTFLIPRGQQLYLAGAHWYVLRIVIMAGYVRLVRARFQVAGGLNGIDKAFIVWAIARGVCPVVLLPQGGMAVNQAAFWLEAFGGYFLLRYVIQDEDDIARAAKTLAVLTVFLGACMLNEHLRNVNIFGYLGGALLTPPMRDGQIRALAIFGHPILAGCFGATLVPLFFWLWKRQIQSAGSGWNSRFDVDGSDVELQHASASLRGRSGRTLSLADSPLYARGALGNRADARTPGNGNEGASMVYRCSRERHRRLWRL